MFVFFFSSFLVIVSFSDMAALVEKQADKITDIGVAADTAHDRAKAGLGQVQQASEYQPGCSIM
jgi:hypothetical protein